MRRFLLSASIFALAACGAAETTAPPADETIAEPAAAEAEEAVEIEYPAAGSYEMDPTHASVTWTISHLGLSNYTVRFNDFDIDLNLNPEDLSATTVTATIDPTSIDANFQGDYKTGHADSGFETWEEDMSRSERFLNSDAFPEITFTSTAVTQTGPNTGTVTGDLALIGQTHPVALDVTYNGVTNFPNAPESDRMGISATATIKRSDFGMTVGQGYLGDDVKVYIEAEFTEVTE